MPVDMKRLRQLTSLVDKGEESNAELREFSKLHGERRYEIAKLLPRPTCCAAIQKYPVITFYVDWDDETSSNVGEGYWYAHSDESDASFEIIRRDKDYYAEHKPDPKFCPFCGASLPKMVRKNPMPENIRVIEDGGYYCGTCEERLDGCLCDPSESAFEPERG